MISYRNLCQTVEFCNCTMRQLEKIHCLHSSLFAILHNSCYRKKEYENISKTTNIFDISWKNKKYVLNFIKTHVDTRWSLLVKNPILIECKQNAVCTCLLVMAFNHQRLQCISFHHREIHLQLPYVDFSVLHTGPSVNRNIMIIVLV